MSNGNGTAPTPSAPVASTLQSPYAVRKIDLTFNIGTGAYGSGPPQQLTVTGLRVFAHAENVIQP